MDEFICQEVINEAAAKVYLALKNLGKEMTDAELYAFKIGFYDGWNGAVDYADSKRIREVSL